MDAITAPLQEHIKGSGGPYFIVPCFQRPYSWGQDECQELWDDILQAGKGERASNHFLGCIICVRESQARWKQTYLIIDGQQRITTLMLLHEAMARSIEEQGKNFGDATASSLRELMCEQNDEKKYKIELSGDDQRHFQDLMRKEHHTDSEQSKIMKNFDFFAKKIKSLSDEEAKRFYERLGRLQAVWILLDKNNDDDDPQYVFESMNFKGQPLVASDLVRNYIIMHLPQGQQEELYKEYWCAIERKLRPEGESKDWLEFFLRDYLVSQKGTSVGTKGTKRIYDEFRTLYPKGVVMDTLKDMKIKSGYYRNIVFPQNAGKLKYVFEDWNRLNSKEGPTPLMLVLYERFAQQDFGEAEFVKIIRLIESYIFRRWACDLRTNVRDEIFRDLIKKINKKEIGKDGFHAGLKQYFHALSAKDKDSASRFPKNEEFIKGLIDKQKFYGTAQCLYALIRLNLQKQEAKTDELKIEHIMPQTLSDEWKESLGPDHEKIHEEFRHKLGNLTLTGYNSKLGNKLFMDKRKCENGFDDSNLQLNKYLQKLEVWDQEEIEKRANMLANQAAKIWVAL